VITNLLLLVFYYPIAALVDLVPKVGPPADASSGFLCDSAHSACDGILSHAGWAGNFLPLSFAATLLALFVVIFPVAMTVRLGLWAYHQFWGSD
jgi:hypothetical protein